MSPKERRASHTEIEIRRRIEFGFQQFEKSYHEKLQELAKIGRVNIARIGLWMDGPCALNFPDLAPYIIAEGEVYGTGLSKYTYGKKVERELAPEWHRIDDEEVVRLSLKLLKRARELKIEKTSISPSSKNKQ